MKWNSRWGVLSVVGALLLSGAAVSGQGIGDITGSLGKIFGEGAFGLAERIIASQLPTQLAPARSYDVHLDREGSSLLQGKLSHVDVTGVDVQTSDGLVIPKMDLHLDEVKLDLASHGLQSIGSGSFSAFLDEHVVTEYIQKRAGVAMRDVQVTFRNNRMVVKASPQLVGIGLPTEVAGKPVLSKRNTINFKASRVAIFGLELPQFAVGALEDRINPIADLSHLKIPAKITSLAVQDNHLVASGSLDFSRPGREP